MRSNSVARQVNLDRPKIGEKCKCDILVKFQTMCLRVYSKIRLTGFTIGGEKQIEMQIKHDAFDFP